MLEAYRQFRQMMEDIENIAAIYDFMELQNSHIDLSDLLRWQYVQSVSAFDKLIHDLIRIGMIEIFQSKRAPTKKYIEFPINMGTYLMMVDSPLFLEDILEQRLVLYYKQFAFQDPKKVADGLAYIWSAGDKWKEIAQEIGDSKESCVTRLRNISSRRNQIVHQGDYPDRWSDRQAIFKDDVVLVKEFMIALGKAIYTCVRLK